MMKSTHADRFAAAQADYRSVVGHDPHRVWATLLFLLTATEDLWHTYSPHLAYKSQTATLKDAPHLSPDEQLVVSVAQSLAGGFATTSRRTVDLAACCLQMDDHGQQPAGATVDTVLAELRVDPDWAVQEVTLQGEVIAAELLHHPSNTAYTLRRRRPGPCATPDGGLVTIVPSAQRPNRGAQ